ncbi:hypothetical protein D3C72_1036210 [compost metagenome]
MENVFNLSKAELLNAIENALGCDEISVEQYAGLLSSVEKWGNEAKLALVDVGFGQVLISY